MLLAPKRLLVVGISLVAVNYGSFFVPTLLAGLINLPQSLGGLYLAAKSQRIAAES